MKNKRLYNIILQNYPDLITRSRSESNFNVEIPPKNNSNEPAQLPVEIAVKIPKNQSATNANQTEGNKDLTKDKNKTGHSSPKVNSNHDVKTKDEQAAVIPAVQNWFRQISKDHHYLRDMPLYRNTMMHRGAMMTIPRYRLRASSLPDVYRNSTWSLESESDDDMVSNNNIKVCLSSFRYYVKEFHQINH